MKPAAKKWVLAACLIAAGVTISGLGVYVSEIDDAPGAALIGFVLMIGSVVLGVRIARRKHGSNEHS